jgi:tetratricopeptide (TPR) repeat protein
MTMPKGWKFKQNADNNASNGTAYNTTTNTGGISQSSSNIPEYYQILEVSVSSTHDEIKQAFKMLTLKYHPDRNDNSQQAHQKYMDIIKAYEVLSDESKRKEYDQSIKKGDITVSTEHYSGISNSASDLICKGSSLYNLGRHLEALPCFDKALSLDPNNAGTWTGKGFSLNNLGRHLEALPCLDKALSLDPNNANTWNWKASSLLNLGRHLEALPCLDKALSLDPNNAVVWAWKGTSLHVLGQYKEAIDCFDKALLIDPNFTEAINVREESRKKAQGGKFKFW